MKVLIAVDLENAPEQVVEGAEPWVSRLEATTDILYVDEVRGVQPYLRDPLAQHMLELEWERLRREAEERLGRLLEGLPEPCRGDQLIETGPAAEGILRHAPSYDGVVVATHGRRGLSHLWLGSVAERVIRASPVPVLVLKAQRA